MLRMLRFPALVGMTAGVLALVLCAGVPASARGNGCLGAKLKAIGKKESGLLGCSAKGATLGASAESACIAKVDAKFIHAYDKPTGCTPPAPLDSQCETLADDCRDALRAALPDGDATNPSRCEAARLKAAGKNAAAKLTCYAKAAAKGAPVGTSSHGCLDKVDAKLKGAFKKMRGCTGDASGSAENIASLVDSRCVAPVVTVDAEGRVTDICSTDRIAASVLFAPTTLTATAKSPSEIDLSWKDTNSSETGYLIERSLDAVTFVQIAAVGVNVHAYKNLGLTEKTTYYYRVRAYQTSETGTTYSDYSNVASATTPADTTAPSTPSQLKAAAISCSEIRLTWKGSTDSGSGVKGYNVYRGGVFLTQVPAPATSFTDSGLLPLTTYSQGPLALCRALACTQRRHPYGRCSNRRRAAPAVPSSCAASAIASIFSHTGRASLGRPAASRETASW